MRMRLIYFLLTITVSTCFCQNSTSIIDEIQKNEFGKGKITIHQDPKIAKMLGRRENIDVQNPERNHIRASGYRVQVFSGNNQRSSKEEAFRKEQLVKALNKDLTTYITYKSPFWRLRVGDFRNYEEAYLLLRQLMKEFPSFGKEMYVVREEIIIPL